MGHLSTMFNGLTRSLSTKKALAGKQQLRNDDDPHYGREAEAVEDMMKEATKNDLILKSSGFVNVEGSNNLASVYTKRGQKGISQDSCIVWEEFGWQADMIFCGMFDGHGPWGHYVSKRVSQSMPSSLLQAWQDTLAQHLHMDDADDDDDSNDKKLHCINNWFNVWKHSYLKTCAAVDQELEHHRKIDAFYSGTTALSVVRQGEKMIVANVGDSRAVLATTSDDGSLVALQLSVDFKPNLPEEAERIEQCNGRVFCLKDEPGVHRVWLPHHHSPGLAMSRSFGDYCVKDFGLISEPDLILRNITNKDQFLLLATDGVWDVLSNQEAVQIVSSSRDRAKAAERLVKYAAQAWRRRRRGIAMDDISAICLFFHSFSSSSSSSFPQVHPDSPSSMLEKSEEIAGYCEKCVSKIGNGS